MSTTGNEFDQPGVNYPDRQDAEGAEDTPGAGDAAREEEPATPAAAEPTHAASGIGVIDEPDGADHHGQDEGRDTLSAGEAQRTPGALGSEQEQRLPAMSQNDASSVDKVAGIAAQTRADVGSEPAERVEEVLRQRLEQSGVALPPDEVAELARQITQGDADSPKSAHGS